MSKRRKSVRIAVGLATAAVLAAGAVHGWVVNNPKWDLSGSNIVKYRANQLPSTWQSRLSSARNAWNGVSGASIDLLRDDSNYGIRVYDGYIDGANATLGLATRYWPWNTYISSATVEMDQNENWYTGSSASGIGANQFDLQGAMAHELGHAMGILHTNASCAGSLRPTMCDSLAPGTTMFRSLATDDANALRYLYP